MRRRSGAPNILKSIDIIVPAFNEEACIEPFYRRLSAVVSLLPYRIRVLFVDDGSEDRTGEICAEIAASDPRVGVIRLSRNFGHQAALTAGLDAARADAVITMDVDLQNPPEKLPDFIRAWENGAEVISGVRVASLGSTFFKRFTSSLFYRMLNLISPLRVTAHSPDFRLLDAKVVAAVLQVREQGRFLRGIYSWVGFRHQVIAYTHGARSGGDSKYSVRDMLLLALRAVLSFSKTPLRFASYLGLLVAGASFLAGACALTLHLAHSRAISGWVWLAVLMGLFSGVQLFFTGILGEYLWQTLEESRRRPLYIVAESLLPGTRTSEEMFRDRSVDAGPSGLLRGFEPPEAP